VSNLLVRALTGAAYVALTLGAAWAGPFTTFLLFLPVVLIAAYEMHRLLWPGGEGIALWWVLLLTAILYTTASMGVFDPTWTALAPVGITAMLLLITVAWRLRLSPGSAPSDLGGLLLAVALVPLPFAAFIHLFAHGTWVFVGFMLLLWTTDTGAYLVGRSLGRTKLLPAVSPNKTVEGFLGGVALAMGVAYVLAQHTGTLDTGTWLICGALVALTSTLGDLLESAFKRSAGVKDSGTVLPGHGGMLDRFDGALLASPTMLLYLALFS
jgi:phosphatidate cytidylyltransferase